MSKSTDFETELSVGGYDYNFKWYGHHQEAEKSDETYPGCDDEWILDSDIQIEIFGEWFLVDNPKFASQTHGSIRPSEKNWKELIDRVQAHMEAGDDL